MAATSFQLTPVPPFRLDFAAWTLRRRSSNVVDRWDGTTYRRVLPLPTGPVEVAVTQSGTPEASQLRVAVTGQPLRASVRRAVATALERLLGLTVDLADFYRFAMHDERFGPLAHRFRGMKPPRYATVFETLINAMACQQVTLTLGIRLLSQLAIAFGTPFDNGAEKVYAFPSPAELAALSPPDLRQLGFSQQKGRAMIEAAQQITHGDLDLELLCEQSDAEAIARLCALRGVGRWTAEYVLLRGLGRTHVFPGDDVGGRNNLKRWLGITTPLDYDGVHQTLSGFSKYGGLIYFHLLLDRLADAGDLSTA